MQYKVIKVGGSGIKSYRALKKFEGLLTDSGSAIIVFSAFGSTTRNLHRAALAALNGNLGEASALINHVQNIHLEIAGDIAEVREFRDSINNHANELITLMKGIEITRDLSARTLDLILANGEILAGIVLEHFLKFNNLKAFVADARSIFITDNKHGNAQPDYGATKRNFLNITESVKETDIIIAGFIARAANGEVSTMGYESSNLTAALIADFVETKSLTVKTDVDGIRSADPAIIDSSVGIEELSFSQAIFAAEAGLKLIYPRMIEILGNKNIPVVYENFDGNETARTVISNGVNNQTPIITTNHALITDSAYPSLTQNHELVTGYSSGTETFYSMPDHRPMRDSIPGFGIVNAIFLNQNQITTALNCINSFEFEHITVSRPAGFVSVTAKLDLVNDISKELHSRLLATT